jgi:hypothetical protein
MSGLQDKVPVSEDFSSDPTLQGILLPEPVVPATHGGSGALPAGHGNRFGLDFQQEQQEAAGQDAVFSGTNRLHLAGGQFTGDDMFCMITKNFYILYIFRHNKRTNSTHYVHVYEFAFSSGRTSLCSSQMLLRVINKKPKSKD